MKEFDVKQRKKAKVIKIEQVSKHLRAAPKRNAHSRKMPVGAEFEAVSVRLAEIGTSWTENLAQLKALVKLDLKRSPVIERLQYDLSDLEPYLTKKAIDALRKEVKSTTFERKGKVIRCRYLVQRFLTEDDKIPEHVLQAWAAMLNYLASKGMCAALCPFAGKRMPDGLQHVSLGTVEDVGPPTILLYSFVFVDERGFVLDDRLSPQQEVNAFSDRMGLARTAHVEGSAGLAPVDFEEWAWQAGR